MKVQRVVTYLKTVLKSRRPKHVRYPIVIAQSEGAYNMSINPKEQSGLTPGHARYYIAHAPAARLRNWLVLWERQLGQL